MASVKTSKEGTARISGESIEYQWKCDSRRLRLSIHAEDGWNQIPFTFPPTFAVDDNSTAAIIKVDKVFT